MRTYIVRVYRARPDDAGSISGVIEDAESDRQEPFHDLNELQAMPSDSILNGQLGLTDLARQEPDDHESVVVIG